MASVDGQVLQALSSQSDEYIAKQLKLWAGKIYRWLSKARTYVYQEEQLSEKLSKNTMQTIEHVKEQYRNLKTAKTFISNQVILKEGYILLNEIGENIRGQKITYSITMSKTGEALSTGGAGTQGVITWQIPMEEFLNLLTSSSRRLMLRSSSALYKMAEQASRKGQGTDNIEKWSEEKLNSFAIFNAQVRHWEQWTNVNEGNVLEAFFRFCGMDLQAQNVAYSDDSAYWRALYNAMYSTMKAPDKFFVGGDIGDTQIKGLAASVTNLNTLIQNLEQVLSILQQAPSTQKTTERYLKKEFSSKYATELQKTQDQVVQELIKFFTSSVSR